MAHIRVVQVAQLVALETEIVQIDSVQPHRVCVAHFTCTIGAMHFLTWYFYYWLSYHLWVMSIKDKKNCMTINELSYLRLTRVTLYDLIKRDLFRRLSQLLISNIVMFMRHWQYSLFNTIIRNCINHPCVIIHASLNTLVCILMQHEVPLLCLFLNIL